jgi:tRNA (guanine37-N1)-methyltransferase
MQINLLTLFPEMFPGPLGASIFADGLKKGLWSLTTTNIRDFATDKHKTVDDSPFGGGAGMVLKPDILEAAITSIPAPGRMIYLSPRGKTLTQDLAAELANAPALTLLCGRYEGIDQRVLDAHEIEEVSIGDYVLAGGEVAAMVLMEAVLRLIPGMVGNHETLNEESFSNSLLEYPHYTRPAKWFDKTGQSWDTPPVLYSGHHAAIQAWRQEKSEELTRERRPDLWAKYLSSLKKQNEKK